MNDYLVLLIVIVVFFVGYGTGWLLHADLHDQRISVVVGGEPRRFSCSQSDDEPQGCSVLTEMPSGERKWIWVPQVKP